MLAGSLTVERSGVMMRAGKVEFVVATIMAAGSAMALAQQQPARPSPSRPAAAQTAPAPAVPATPAAAQRTETITYDSWTVTCQDIVEARSKKTCSALMKVSDQKSGD